MTTHPFIYLFVSIAIAYLIFFNLALIFWIRPRFIFKSQPEGAGEKLSSQLLSKESLVLWALFITSFILGVGTSLIKMLNELLLR
ncbi:MAG: hypothetical protein HN353_06190 [Bdellovibrionales bacterium]|jgi:hypothetical protein|nr:hypothetical protein [Bdellovibrionales bacterium]MBT3526222.1 hypothetical protein [Bdellovibrionales bacterium]MBT7668178.1 hypothetical protein [Bdellovibrionales bacterium]MBT7768296.1 hypothetical protein [Bdellovibrionales bacterium]